jgi:nitric oxide reductase subunit B
MKSIYWLLRIALFLLLMGLLWGHLASESYRMKEATSGILPFSVLRPLHVSSVYFGIIISGLALMLWGLYRENLLKQHLSWLKVHLFLWIIALTGIFVSYFSGNFGGREYWEFPPIWSIPIILSYMLLLWIYIRNLTPVKSWPVYYWMWLSGLVFFLFVFLENYLWLFPFFQQDLVSDITIQWKVNGSIVGAVNQIVYGVAMYLMVKISGDDAFAKKPIVFALFFLGLFNLMFNWGHHIYLVPTDRSIHHISYAVSMTEWIILIRIFYLFKRQLKEQKTFYALFPYRFLMAADYWVMLNLFLALLMSIPIINLFTHGTHITVAHAMGTTIGINTMIILAGAFYLIVPKMSKLSSQILHTLFWGVQASLLLMLSFLITMGIIKGKWQITPSELTFSKLQDSLQPYIYGFIASGTVLFITMTLLLGYLLFKSFRK